MKAFVAVTDNSWFEYLASNRPDEVNFWRPGGNMVFKALNPGELLLFKLHAPLNYIVGGGFFLRFSILPSSLAWDAFNVKNGMPDRNSFMKAIRGHRHGEGRSIQDPKIGCILLTAPFFFSRDQWIPMPSDFQLNTVQGKTYSDETTIGKSLFEQVQERMRLEPHRVALSGNSPYSFPSRDTSELRIGEPDPNLPRYGTDFITHARLGQGGFRIFVTEAYSRRCALTGEKTLPVLEAAHIKPYADSGPHRTSNGLLLRSDLHILFDRGFITVDEDRRIHVSQRIKEEFGNGKEYYALNGRSLMMLPEKEEERPSREFLLWHNSNRYVG